MHHFYSRLIGVAVAGSAVLSGCGGSLGGSLGQANVDEGLFIGTTSTNRATTMFVDNAGTFYLFYSDPVDPTLIAGAIQGTTAQSGGSYTSADGVDINLEAPAAPKTATLVGNYVTAQSINGAITYPINGSTVAFSGTYNPAGYQAAANLATVAGTYTGKGGTSMLSETNNLTISSTGAVSGSGTSGCTYSGTAATLVKGNGYSVTLTFGAAPCALPGAVTTGIAYLDSANKRLYTVGLIPTRTDGFVFSGTKP